MKIIDLNLKFMSDMQYSNKPNKIILHHAASFRCSIEDVHYWHLKRGWAGCGYHFFIRKDGSAYKGREENIVGAHCKGHNSGSIGVCVEGNYMVDNMLGVQREAVIEVCKYIIGKHPIKHIYGHKDFAKTDCPGVKFPFQEIIDKVFDDSTPAAIDSYPGYCMKRIKANYDKNVVEIQKRLVEIGYDVGGCGADGYFGKDTEGAVREFQKDVGILVDGVVGPIMWKSLKEYYNTK